MRFRNIFSFAITGAFILFAGSNIQAQTPSPSADILNKIHEVENSLAGSTGTEFDSSLNILNRMNFYRIKGVSIAVIHNYVLEWAKGYGWADASSKTPVSAHTLFQAASISKSLNGVGVIKLAQKNRLDLYADINQYLTSWKFTYDSISKNKKISTIELLSHTAGLNVHGFPGYERGAALPTVIQILDGIPPANTSAIRSMMEPGLRSEYSGGGITISQLIVMDITRMPYATYMRDEVLTPLGMNSSSFEQPNNSEPDLLSTGYRTNGDEIAGKYHIYPEQAAAGLWTNPTDLSKYIIETQLAYEGKSAKVLNQQMTRLRLTPYLNDFAALGVFINNQDGTEYFQHSGGNEGFRCQYYGSLAGGNGLVIMVNSDNGTIIQEIVNSIARVYHFKGLSKTTTLPKKSNLFVLSATGLILALLSILILVIFRVKQRR